MIRTRPPARLTVEPWRLEFWRLAGVWCGGTRDLPRSMAGQVFGGNGPDPDWAPANEKRRKAKLKAFEERSEQRRKAA